MLGIICLTCKKKTSIQVHVFNPALDEYVSNATVVLVEKTGDGGGLFGGADAKCKEIATATSDANGNCYFDKEKLKRNNGYDYFCVVKESWGISQGYSCANHTSGFIDKGKANDVIAYDECVAYLQVQYNNLLNPSQSGDSLIVSLTTIEYPNPKGGVVYGGGGVFGAFPYYGCNGFPFAAVLTLDPIETIGQRLKRSIRKRKMGIVTVSVDTIKVYPNQSNIVQIDW